MSMKKFTKRATDKNTFKDLGGFISFCSDFLSFISDPDNIQAEIVSQNENQYRFLQYKRDGSFQVTRPFNSNLLISADTFKQSANEFLKTIKSAKTSATTEISSREIINTVTYTLQQSVGLALDALPAGKSNKARKLNGDMFEHLIRLILETAGVSCRAGVVQVPVLIDGEEAFPMSYQHDLIVEQKDVVKLIGSVKTSSKDRIDKIFVDKFLYNKLTSSNVPHIAIFLNDVQRKKTRRENEYGISSTFLPGHFKGYTVKLNPLDGVYYCDIRPNMQTEAVLKDHIQTFDNLIIDDIWKFLK